MPVFFRGYSGGVFHNELEDRYFLPGFIRGNCGGTFHIKLEGRYFLPACFRGNLVLFFSQKVRHEERFLCLY